MSRAEANARRSDLGQRGSVSAEAALVVPVLVLIILGGVHFGKVLMLRHQLAAATDVATRTAALAQTLGTWKDKFKCSFRKIKKNFFLLTFRYQHAPDFMKPGGPIGQQDFR